MFSALLQWLRGKFAGSDDFEKVARESASQRDPSEILATRPEESTLPVLSLQQYRRIVGGFTPPTMEQIEAFAFFVSGAKSWYKHLPLLPPGVPFTFYIDPWIGLDRILERNGRAVFVHRTNESPKFHYTWMTTENYRSRFGRLTFFCAAGTALYLPLSVRLQDQREVHGVLDNNWCRASVHLADETEWRLPAEIVEAGSTRLTGVMHERALTAGPWLRSRIVRREADELPWPEETGGAETVRKIIVRCRELEKTGETFDPDDELSSLLEPERRRLHRETVQTIERVVQLI